MAGRPVILIVRDGWGRNPNREHDAFNAIHLASTPVGDALLRDYPWTFIKTSGERITLSTIKRHLSNIISGLHHEL